jgi:hypothetical protein
MLQEAKFTSLKDAWCLPKNLLEISLVFTALLISSWSSGYGRIPVPDKGKSFLETINFFKAGSVWSAPSLWGPIMP